MTQQTHAKVASSTPLGLPNGKIATNHLEKYIWDAAHEGLRRFTSQAGLTVHYGSIEQGYRDLCNRCFNEEVAKSSEIDFSQVQFEPLDVPDAAGVSHRLHFEVRLLGEKVSLQAFELIDGEPGGYEFQVLGDAEGDGKRRSPGTSSGTW